MKNNNIIYLALQTYEQKARVQASVLSLDYVSDHTYKIYIYTDLNIKPEDFIGIKPNIEIIIKTYYYDNVSYIYKHKINTLINFIEEYNERALFIDNDTFYYEDPIELFDRINDTTILMNYTEIVMGDFKYEDYNGKANNELLFAMPKMTELSGFPINSESRVYNAGVIGVNPIHLKDLKDGLVLCDYILKEYKARIAEQIALSIIFQTRFTVKFVDDKIFHYHFHKESCELLSYVFGTKKIYFGKEYTYFKKFILKEDNPKVKFEDLIPIIVHSTKFTMGGSYKRLFGYIAPESKMFKMLDGELYAEKKRYKKLFNQTGSYFDKKD